MSVEAGFWDHAEELRRVILKAVALVVGLACVCFAVMPELFDCVILAPCRADFPLYVLFDNVSGSHLSTERHDISLVNIQLASQFFVHMSASLWMAVVLAFPVIIYLLWGFVSPGLYENEKRGAGAVLMGGVVMFYIGVAVGYWLVFPLTLRFLADYHLSTLIPNHISLDSYIDNFMLLNLTMGLVFELPVVAWLLGRMGLIDRSVFTIFRRHAIVALLILAAVITPSGDPLTLMVVFVPLYLLWELSGVLVKPRVADTETISVK